MHVICRDLRPYSVVDNVGFRWMLHTLEPRYKIPQCDHMVDTAVPKMHEDVKKVGETLNTALRADLTCEGWTSRATEWYVTVPTHL